MIVVQILDGNSDELEYFIQSLAEVTECYCTVMREVLLDQHVTIESAHLRDCEYADGTEGLGANVKYFTLCDVCAKLAISGGLQTIEGDLSGSDVSFEGSVGNLYGKASSHDFLVSHLTECQLLGAGIAAMEAHEGILMGVIVLALDGLLEHVCRNGVVDVKQGNGISTYAGTDELGQTSVNVNLTGYGDTHTGKTAVYVAGNETKLGLECRPALAGDGNILSVASVCLNPVKQGQLILSQLLKNLRLLVACAQLSCHLSNLSGDSCITCMLVECFEQIQLGVLLDLNAQVVKLFDGSVTSKEVKRSGTKGNDLQIGKSDDGASDGNELVDHVCALLCSTNGVLRDVSLNIAKLQIVACIQHAAVCIATSVLQISLALLCSCNEDGGTIKVLCKQGLGDFGTEVSKIYAKCVTSGLLYVLKSLNHVDLALNDTNGALINVSSAILIGISLYQRLSSVNGQALGEAVTANSNDTNFYLG